MPTTPGNDTDDPHARALSIAPTDPPSNLLARAAQRQARAEQLGWFLAANDGTARPPPLFALGLLVTALAALRLAAGVSSFVGFLEWIGAAAIFVLGIALVRRGTRAIRWRRAHAASARVVAKAPTARVRRGIDRESNRWFDAHWLGEGGPALNEERLAVEAVVHGRAVLVELTPAGKGARVVVHVGGLLSQSAAEAIERLRAWVENSGYEPILLDSRLRIVRGRDGTLEMDGRWHVEDAERLVVVLREIARVLADDAAPTRLGSLPSDTSR